MVKNNRHAPKRGDVVWIDMSPHLGHEQGGRRPAIILSPVIYNQKVGLALVCPITNRTKGYPYEVPLPKGLAVSGVVLADQTKSVDWRARRAEHVDSVPHAVVVDVLAKLKTLLWS